MHDWISKLKLGWVTVHVGGTGLATKHWSDKSEGFTWHHQHEEHAIARGFEGMPPRKN